VDVSSATSPAASSASSGSSECDADDVFYDAESTFASASSSPSALNTVTDDAAVTKAARDSELIALLRVPENVGGMPAGRLRPLALTLLFFPDTTIFVPRTQEHPAMTEDQIEEEHMMMARLGTSSEAAAMRAEIQGQSVKLDMQAFKAANPGCVFADFIRWYSPNDWVIPDDDMADGTHDVSATRSGSGEVRASAATEGRATLSTRMKDPSNIWQQLWRSATPLVCHQQPQLFNAEKEAECALHYLETLPLPDVLLLCSSIAVALSVHIFARSEPAHMGLPVIQRSIDGLQSHLRQHCLDSGLYDTSWAMETCQMLAQAEQLCAKAQAVATLLQPCSMQLVGALVDEEQASLTEIEDRVRMLQLFSTATSSATGAPCLPPPAIRDYACVHHDIHVDESVSGTSRPLGLYDGDRQDPGM
jgi:hypothetical protein